MAEEFNQEDLELARESVFELSAYQEYNQQLESNILDVIDGLYLPMLRPAKPLPIKPL